MDPSLGFSTVNNQIWQCFSSSPNSLQMPNISLYYFPMSVLISSKLTDSQKVPAMLKAPLRTVPTFRSKEGGVGPA